MNVNSSHELKNVCRSLVLGGLTVLLAGNFTFYALGNSFCTLGLASNIFGVGAIATGACLWTWHQRGEQKWHKLLLPFVFTLIAALAAQIGFLCLHHSSLGALVSVGCGLFGAASLAYAFGKMHQTFTSVRSRKEASYFYALTRYVGHEPPQQILEQFPDFEEKYEMLKENEEEAKNILLEYPIFSFQINPKSIANENIRDLFETTRGFLYTTLQVEGDKELLAAIDEMISLEDKV